MLEMEMVSLTILPTYPAPIEIGSADNLITGSLVGEIRLCSVRLSPSGILSVPTRCRFQIPAWLSSNETTKVRELLLAIILPTLKLDLSMPPLDVSRSSQE